MSVRCRSGSVFLGALFYCASAANAATVTVVVRPYLADTQGELKPEIHLYQKGSHKDFWPAAHALSASDIPLGTYEIDVFQPGFKRFHRDVDVISNQTDIRVVLLVASEATGRPLGLAGTIVSAKDYSGMWVLAFPLTGNPSDVAETKVGTDGHFKVTVSVAGPYLVALIRGDDILSCKSIYIGPDSPDVQISADR